MLPWLLLASVCALHVSRGGGVRVCAPPPPPLASSHPPLLNSYPPPDLLLPLPFLPLLFPSLLFLQCSQWRATSLSGWRSGRPLPQAGFAAHLWRCSRAAGDDKHTHTHTRATEVQAANRKETVVRGWRFQLAARRAFSYSSLHWCSFLRAQNQQPKITIHHLKGKRMAFLYTREHS